MNYNKTGVYKQCKNCKKEFYVFPCRATRTKFCSKKCIKTSTVLNCFQCDKKIKVINFYLKKMKRHFCSKRCFYKFGNKITNCNLCNKKITTIKASSKKYCGSICYHKSKLGKKRLAHSLRMLGKFNPNWKDGISFLPYPPEFNQPLKKEIRKRDNYTCQRCGKLEKAEIKEFGWNLAIHHIDYNKMNCKDDNLITVCVGCNSSVNFNRNHWINYFKEKIYV